jgi:DNA-binding IclR family transcriptional regulator
MMQLNRLSRALGECNIVGCQEDESDHVVKSAGRVLRILELFDVLRREALVSEVSELLSFPQSSTSVLLRSLVITGYLYFNPETRAFGPTTRVALLGSWINGPIVSDGVLSRLIESVSRRTGQAVVLAVRNRIWSEYIHVVQGTDPLRMFMIKGSRRPLVDSGTGFALLAELPDNEIKRITLRYNAESGEHVSMSGLLDEVNKVRSQGWSSSYDRVTKGGGIISMRLPPLENQERLVIGIAGSTSILRENESRFVNALLEETAAHVSGIHVNHTPLPV